MYSIFNNLVLPIIIGVLLTSAFAPFNCFFSLIIALTGFLALINNANTKKKQFIIGFCFGLGHFTSSLYWIAYALLFEKEKFAWLIPLAVLGIPACLSIFTGLFSIIINCFKSERNNQIFAFASLWVIIEFARSHLILDFPWNLLGYASNFSLELMQIASVVGVYGLSFIIAVCSTIFYTKSLKSIAVVYSFLVCILIWGQYRITSAEQNKDEQATSVLIRLVQPNIKESHQGDQRKQLENIDILSKLSLTERHDKMNFIVWPEAAFPFTVDLESPWLQVLSQLLPPQGYLIFGADRYAKETGKDTYYNSAIVINSKGQLIDFYDKTILVPFGEYIPFKQIFPFINKIAYGLGEFSGNLTPRSIFIKNFGEIRLLICYEAIFTAGFLNDLSDNTLFFLNITNDAWFFDSIGPYQHFAMARMRTVEYGMPLIRAANTGISGVINAYGKVISTSDLYTTKVIDINLPPRIDRTIYADSYFYVIGTIIFIFFITLISLVFQLMGKRSGKSNLF